MKAVATVLYEIEDLRELDKLPFGQMVLRYDKQYGFHSLLTVGVDEFSKNTKRYAYLLLNAPKLPEVRKFASEVSV